MLTLSGGISYYMYSIFETVTPSRGLKASMTFQEKNMPGVFSLGMSFIYIFEAEITFRFVQNFLYLTAA